MSTCFYSKSSPNMRKQQKRIKWKLWKTFDFNFEIFFLISHSLWFQLTTQKPLLNSASTLCLILRFDSFFTDTDAHALWKKIDRSLSEKLTSVVFRNRTTPTIVNLGALILALIRTVLCKAGAFWTYISFASFEGSLHTIRRYFQFEIKIGSGLLCAITT